MRRRTLTPFLIATLAAGCGGDSGGPPAPDPYAFELLQPYDSAGALRVDTLAFHWPRSMLPVKIWVENAATLPAEVAGAIALWKDAFANGEWNAAVVTDSTTADILVRYLPIGAPARGGLRLRAQGLFCEGVTILDTVATRFQLRLPVRVRVYELPTAPVPGTCLGQVTAHELGHALGILRHSPFDDDLMFDVPTAAVPSDRDLATARRAYHTPADLVPLRP